MRCAWTRWSSSSIAIIKDRSLFLINSLDIGRFILAIVENCWNIAPIHGIQLVVDGPFSLIFRSPVCAGAIGIKAADIDPLRRADVVRLRLKHHLHICAVRRNLIASLNRAVPALCISRQLISFRIQDQRSFRRVNGYFLTFIVLIDALRCKMKSGRLLLVADADAFFFLTLWRISQFDLQVFNFTAKGRACRLFNISFIQSNTDPHPQLAQSRISHGRIFLEADSIVTRSRYFGKLTGFIFIKDAIVIKIYPSADIGLFVAIRRSMEPQRVVSVMKTVYSEKVVGFSDQIIRQQLIHPFIGQICLLIMLPVIPRRGVNVRLYSA
ncbi:hypothetical protein STRDD11_01075 [Streptococcus sp. DD11]|nr:hypothetical protein STRDD11_01075 [Streptococcus sp. DD11]